jgi:hypothetical protein
MDVVLHGVRPGVASPALLEKQRKEFLMFEMTYGAAFLIGAGVLWLVMTLALLLFAARS